MMLGEGRAKVVTGAWSGWQCLFAHSLRKFSMRDWGIEQKWMSILLPLLLLYNGRCQLYSGAFPLNAERWDASCRWPGPGFQRPGGPRRSRW